MYCSYAVLLSIYALYMYRCYGRLVIVETVIANRGQIKYNWVSIVLPSFRDECGANYTTSREIDCTLWNEKFITYILISIHLNKRRTNIALHSVKTH